MNSESSSLSLKVPDHLFRQLYLGVVHFVRYFIELVDRRHLANFIGLPEGKHHETTFPGLHGDDILPSIQRELPDASLPTQRFTKNGERFPGDLAVGSQVVRALHINRIDRVDVGKAE